LKGGPAKEEKKEKTKMKFFAIDMSGKVIDINFKNEDSIDEAFNRIFEGGSMSGQIVDGCGKSVFVDVSYGYSRNRSEMDCAKRTLSKV
jgi:hypothetical protein